MRAIFAKLAVVIGFWSSCSAMASDAYYYLHPIADRQWLLEIQWTENNQPQEFRAIIVPGQKIPYGTFRPFFVQGPNSTLRPLNEHDRKIWADVRDEVKERPFQIQTEIVDLLDEALTRPHQPDYAPAQFVEIKSKNDTQGAWVIGSYFLGDRQIYVLTQSTENLCTRINIHHRELCLE